MYAWPLWLIHRCLSVSLVVLRSILLKMHFFLSAVPHFCEEIRSGCFSSRDEAYGALSIKENVRGGNAKGK